MRSSSEDSDIETHPDLLSNASHQRACERHSWNLEKFALRAPLRAFVETVEKPQIAQIFMKKVFCFQYPFFRESTFPTGSLASVGPTNQVQFVLSSETF
jgi:hypothetical protein